MPEPEGLCMMGVELDHRDVAVLRCPVSHQSLELRGDTLVNPQGREYPIQRRVVQLLPNGAANDIVREFYEEIGWDRGDDGLHAETRAFVDNRAAPAAYTRRCIRRLGRYFKGGGTYLLDAGCGSIPHEALIPYSDPFERRICLDLSARGLQQAAEKLGDKGIYLQGDITNIPLQDNSMDAITCNHVIYQLPTAEMQIQALHELWRVLKPGGVAVVVSWFENSRLGWRLSRIAGFLGMNNREHVRPGADGGPPIHVTQDPEWFEGRQWPFELRYDSFRLVDNGFMQRHVTDDIRGSIFLWGLYGLQCAAPAYCGRRGIIPAVVFRKPK